MAAGAASPAAGAGMEVEDEEQIAALEDDDLAKAVVMVPWVQAVQGEPQGIQQGVHHGVGQGVH